MTEVAEPDDAAGAADGAADDDGDDAADDDGDDAADDDGDDAEDAEDAEDADAGDASPPTGALARSQAARRRRVLDATLALARGGGFDAVQMRDVAAEANVALGTVYRYFSSKERLLLEAMAEQLEDLRRYLESHPPAGDTAAARVIAVLRRANAALARQPDVTAAMVRAYGACREENASVIERVGGTTNAIIMTAIGTTGEREARLARTVTQVWLSSLIGWAGGVDPMSRVDDDLDHAARMLLGEE